MKMKVEEKHFLNMAGEYGVCAELNKRNIFSSITYGNHKAADIIIFKDDKIFRIEVKTSTTKKVVTGFFQKYDSKDQKPAPDFWVLVHIDTKTFISSFYLLSHIEMGDEQMISDKKESWSLTKGVDNIEFSRLEKYKDKWDKLLNS